MADAAGDAAGDQGPPPPQGAAVGTVSIRVIVPDLRNGDIATITQAAPRASIPTRYNWVAIAGLPSTDAVRHVDAIVRATYAQYLAGSTGTVNDAMRAEARKAAIVIGAIRASCAQAWNLQVADMNVEECSGSGSAFTGGAAGAMGTVTVGQGTAGGNHTVAMGMEALTEADVEVINLMFYLGAAVPVMQGISLVLSGHHYLPTTKNHFMGMKRQALQLSSDAVKQWVDALGESFDDYAFHKACHPISPPVKRRWAKDPTIATRLVASGHTSVAIRVPALPSDAQGCKAAVAVIIKAAPVIHGMLHHVSWDMGLARIRAVEAAAEGAAEMEAVVQAKDWMAAQGARVGFCAGIVQYMSETGGATQETTLRAYSIRRIMSDHAAEVSKGATYCRAYMARLREQAADGSFPDPNIQA
jgi:hypothetical protein